MDHRNTLNNLTGKEWLRFLKSWYVFDALQKDLREERKISEECNQHPATFSPTMIAEWIKFFTKPGMVVLDPFVGIGSTLVACERTGRKGIGIELNSQFKHICEKRVPKKHIIIKGDVRNIDEMNIPEIDYCITSPPYGDMLHKIDVNQKVRLKKNLKTRYGDDTRDLGNIRDYNLFLDNICLVFDKIFDKLRDGAYLTIIIQNVIDRSVMLPLAWELAIKLSRKPYRYVLKKEKLWCQDHKPLHPFGYPYAWVSNTHHHYCLVFRKEGIS